MSRKWVEKEGPSWIEQGIISHEQYLRILSLYPERHRVMGLLPIFASILIGAGILTFIASNWQMIPHLVRLAIIIASIAGFYIAGDAALKRGSKNLGISLIAIGLIAFGAGIMLAGQMFHYVAYDAGSFIIWGLAGIALTYLLQSRYLFLLTFAILIVAQIYSAFEFEEFSYLVFILSFIGLGVYWWRFKQALLSWFMAIGLFLHSMFYLLYHQESLTWLLIVGMGLYAVGDWLQEKSKVYPLQTVPLIVSSIFAVFFIFFLNEFQNWENFANVYAFLSLSGIIFLLSLYGKLKSGKTDTILDWLLFLPLFYLTSYGDYLYLIMLFGYSGYLLWMGYRQEWRFKINLGTVLFLLCTLLGYVQLAWAFMPKSLFFLVGGILLFGLSWILEKRRRGFIKKNQANIYPDETDRRES